MQNLIYDEAPYDILFYDANLDVYRNDRFAGWQNMPADGTPFFTYGMLDYTLLTDATAQPSPTAEAPAASASAGTSAPTAPSAAPSASPTTDGAGDSGSSSMPLLVLALVAIVAVVGGLLYTRRGKAQVEDE